MAEISHSQTLGAVGAPEPRHPRVQGFVATGFVSTGGHERETPMETLSVDAHGQAGAEPVAAMTGHGAFLLPQTNGRPGGASLPIPQSAIRIPQGQRVAPSRRTMLGDDGNQTCRAEIT